MEEGQECKSSGSPDRFPPALSQMSRPDPSLAGHCAGPMKTVSIEGITKDITQETLELYFENERQSEGGEIKRVKLDLKKGMALIEFADEEAAVRVSTKKTHVLNGKELQATLHNETHPSNMVKVTGLSPSVAEESLEMYFESKKRSNGGDVTDIRRSGNAVYITFQEPGVAQNVAAKTHHTLLGMKLTVQLDDPAQHGGDKKTLVVKNYQLVSLETVSMYFENKRRSGGGDHEMKVEKGTLYLTFQSEEVVERVLNRCPHKVEGKTLTVTRLDEEAEHSGEDEKPRTTISVSGYKKDCTDDSISLYFENKRTSGGGDIVGDIRRHPKKDIIYIEFENEEVAKRVVSQTHTLNANRLKVELVEPQVMYRNKALISGVPEIDSLESLVDYLEGRTKKDVSQILFGEEPGEVVVSFGDESDGLDFAEMEKELGKRPFKQEKRSFTLKVSHVPQTKSVTVQDIAPGSSEDQIRLYFENKRRSGGGDVSDVVVRPDEKYAVVTFKEVEAAEAVCQREHIINKVKVKASLCFECLGEKGGSLEPPVTKLPEPLPKIGINSNILRYLTSNKSGRDVMGKALEKVKAKFDVDVGQGVITFVPAFDLSSPDANCLVKTWTRNVEESWRAVNDCLEMKTIQANSEIWTELKSSLKPVDDKFQVYTEETDFKIVVVGPKAQVSDVASSLETVKNTIQVKCDKRKTQVSDKMKLQPLKLMLLVKKGILNHLRLDDLKLNFNDQTGEISLTGQEGDITKAKTDIYEEVNKIKVETVVCHFTPGELEFLRQEHVHRFLQKQMDEHSTSVEGCWEKGTEGLKVYFFTDKGLEDVKRYLKGAVKETVHKLDQENLPLLQSFQYKKLIEQLTREHDQRLCVQTDLNNRQLVITTVSSEANIVAEQITDFLKMNSMYNEVFKGDKMKLKFIILHCQDRLKMVETDLKDIPINFTTSTRPEYTIRLESTKDGCHLAKRKLLEIVQDVKCHKRDLERPGLKEFLKSEEILQQLEKESRCVIDIDNGTNFEDEDVNEDLDFTHSIPFECQFDEDRKLLVAVGEMTSLAGDVEAFIVEVSSKLNSDSKQSWEVMQKAGDIPASELRRFARGQDIMEGEVFCTSPGNLRCSHIIHVVGPCTRYTQKDTIASVVVESLQEAARRNLRSVTLPSFFTGSVTSTKDALRGVVEGVYMFYRQNRNSSITDTYLCLETWEHCHSLWDIAVDVFGPENISNCEEMSTGDSLHGGNRQGMGLRKEIKKERTEELEAYRAKQGYIEKFEGFVSKDTDKAKSLLNQKKPAKPSTKPPDANPASAPPNVSRQETVPRFQNVSKPTKVTLCFYTDHEYEVSKAVNWIYDSWDKNSLRKDIQESFNEEDALKMKQKDKVKGPVKTVRVEGVTKDLSKDTLELYFESKKRSHGGEITDIKLDERRRISLIDFADHEVAKRVTEKKKHQLEGKTLTAVLHDPHHDGNAGENRGPMKTVHIDGVTKEITQETLELYFENKRRSEGGEISSIKLYLNKGMALIEFADAEAAVRVSTKKTHVVNGKELQATLHDETHPSTPSNTVKVTGLSPSVAQETLELYFENKKRSNGGDITDIRRAGNAVYITFKDPGVAEKVAAKTEHNLKGVRLTVQLDDPAQHGGDKKTLVVKNYQPAPPETVSMYFENKRRSGGGDHEMKEGMWKIYLMFQSEEVVERVLKQCPHKVEGRTLTVTRLDEEADDSGEDEKPRTTISVSGYKKDCTDDSISLYFENRRKSGGGDIVGDIRRHPKKDIIYIEFENEEVAKRVVSRTHTLNGNRLKVELVEPQVMYKNKALISGVPEIDSLESLVDYLERRTKKDVSQILFGEEPGEVVVSFGDESDGLDFAEMEKELGKRPFKQEGKRVTLKVSQVPQTRSVTVQDIGPGITEDQIRLYFENKRRSGGEDVSDVVVRQEEKYAVVTFKEVDAAEAVCQREHTINKVKVKASLCFECLGEKGGSLEAPVTRLPDPLTKIGINSNILRYLTSNEYGRDVMDKALEKVKAKFDVDVGERVITFVPAFDLSSPDAKNLVKTWTGKVEESWKAVNDCLEMKSIQANSEIWTELKSSLKPVDDKFQVYTEDTNFTIVVVGPKAQVSDVASSLETVKNTIQVKCDKRKTQVSDKMKLQPPKLMLLVKQKILDHLRLDDLKLNFNDQTGEITLTGQEGDITKAKTDIYEEVNKIKVETVVSHFTPGELEFLRQEHVHGFLQKQVDEHSPSVEGCWEKGTEGLEIYFFTDKGLEDVKRYLKGAVKETVHKLDQENLPVLQSTKYKQLIEQLTREHDQRLFVQTDLNNRQLVITTVSSETNIVAEQITDFLKMNSIYNELFKGDKMKLKFIIMHCQDRLKTVETELKDILINFTTSTRPEYTIRLESTKDGCHLAKRKLLEIVQDVKCHQRNLEQPGLKEFLKSEEILQQLEKESRCVIDIDDGTNFEEEDVYEDLGFTHSIPFECQFDEDRKLLVVVGEMTSHAGDVEAFIVEVSSKLNSDSKQSWEVMQKAGDIPASELRRFARGQDIMEGEVFCTSPGNLRCSHIIHVVGPCTRYRQKDTIALVVVESLQEAVKKGLRSVALPSFFIESVTSTKDALRGVVEGVHMFYRQNRNSSITDTYLCLETWEHCHSLWDIAVDVFGPENISNCEEMSTGDNLHGGNRQGMGLRKEIKMERTEELEAYRDKQGYIEKIEGVVSKDTDKGKSLLNLKKPAKPSTKPPVANPASAPPNVSRQGTLPRFQNVSKPPKVTLCFYTDHEYEVAKAVNWIYDSLDKHSLRKDIKESFNEEDALKMEQKDKVKVAKRVVSRTHTLKGNRLKVELVEPQVMYRNKALISGIPEIDSSEKIVSHQQEQQPQQHQHQQSQFKQPYPHPQYPHLQQQFNQEPFPTQQQFQQQHQHQYSLQSEQQNYPQPGYYQYAHGLAYPEQQQHGQPHYQDQLPHQHLQYQQHQGQQHYQYQLEHHQHQYQQHYGHQQYQQDVHQPQYNQQENPFQEQDQAQHKKRAAVRVSTKKTHVVNGKELQATLHDETHPSTPCNTVKVTGLSPSVAQDTIELYFENKKRSNGGDITDIRRAGNAVYITFQEPGVAQNVAAKIHHTLKGVKLTVQLDDLSLHVSDQMTLVVKNYQPVFPDTISLYFENKRRSGGGDNEMREEKGKMYLTFQSEEVVERVLNRCPHKVEGKTLTVTRLDEEAEDSGEDEKPRTTISVSGYKKDCTDDSISLYFENKRKSGGGNTVGNIRRHPKKDIIYIEFENEEVAKRVVSRTHTLNGNRLKVELVEPQVMYKNKALISGVPEIDSPESLVHYLEGRTKKDVSQILFGEEAGEVVVSFGDESDGLDFAEFEKQLGKKPFKQGGRRVTLKVSRVPQTRSVTVQDIPPGSTEIQIRLYFENKRRSGGGDVSEVTIRPEEKYAVVTFTEVEVAEAVCQREHIISKVKVKASLCFECLGEKGGSLEAPVTKVPDPLTLSGININILRYLTSNEYGRDVMDKALEKVKAKSDIDVGEGVITFVPAFDMSSPDAKNLVKTWTGKVEESWKAVNDCLETVKNTTQVRCGKRKPQVSDKMQLQPPKQMLLVKQGILDHLRLDDLKLNFNTQTGEITLTGQEGDITKAKTDIYEEVNKIKVETVVSHFTPGELKFLRQEHVHRFLQKQVDEHSTSVEGCWEKGTEGLNVYFFTNKGLEDVKRYLKGAVKETVHKLDQENLPLLQSTKYKQLMEQLTREHDQRLFVQTDLNNRQLVITTVSSEAKFIAEQITDFLKINSIYKELFKGDKMKIRFVIMHCQDHLKTVETSLKDIPVHFTTSTHPEFTIRLESTKKGCPVAKRKLKEIVSDVKCYKRDLERPGLNEFLKSGEILQQIEKETRCVIDIDGGTNFEYEDVYEDLGFAHSIPFECQFDEDRKLLVVVGAMTSLAGDVEAVIVEVSSYLNSDSRQSWEVMQKAGDRPASELRRFARGQDIMEGEVFCTSPGNLRCSHIIHVVGPCTRYRQKDTIASVVVEILQEAVKKNLRSVALPSFFTGSVTSTQDTLRGVVEGVHMFYRQNLNSSITDTYLCLETWEHCQSLWDIAVDVFGPENIRNNDEMITGGNRRGMGLRKESMKDLEHSMTVEAEIQNFPVRLKDIPRPRILLVKADMGVEEADVIVNSSGTSLNLSQGQVSKSLHKNAGPAIQAECSEKYPKGIKMGDIAVTKGGNMQCVKVIYHCTLPQWKDDTGEKTFTNVMNALLKRANDEKMETMAIPALGTGNLGYSRQLVAKLMYQTVTDFCRNTPGATIKDVLFIVYPKDPLTIEAFEVEHRQYMESIGGKVPVSISEMIKERKEELDAYRGKQGYIEKFGGALSKVTGKAKSIWNQKKPAPPSKKPAVANPAPPLPSFSRQRTLPRTQCVSKPAKDTLCFYTDDEFEVSKAVNRIYGSWDKNSLRKDTEDPTIKKLTDNQIKQLKQIENKHSISIEVDKSKGLMHLYGLKTNVLNANLDILDKIREVEREQKHKEYADDVQRLVQWSFEEINEDGEENMVPYDPDVNLKLERAFRQDKLKQFSYSGYVFDFENWIEYPENDKGDAVKMIRKDKVKGANEKLPQSWEDMAGDKDMEIKAVNMNSQEFSTVKTNFMKALGNVPATIVRVDRIQSKTLFQQYQAKKEQLTRHNPGVEVEKTLWHGTNKEAALSIAKLGFNRSYCNKKDNAYGEGVYFTNDAGYAARSQYAPADGQGKRHIFQSKVLTGSFTRGKPKMRVPPAKDGSSTHNLYDSVVDDPTNPHNFVIFGDTQAYPEYLITLQ